MSLILFNASSFRDAGLQHPLCKWLQRAGKQQFRAYYPEPKLQKHTTSKEVPTYRNIMTAQRREVEAANREAAVAVPFVISQYIQSNPLQP
jgi:ribosomal protein S30